MYRLDIRYVYPFVVIALAIGFSVGGCELIASVDRTKIPGAGGSSQGGAGGNPTSTGGSAGSTTTGGMAGMGGEA
ncbi:MAG TPA: hypothetical protein VFB62_23925, partial [Polyangiaceae bacterium]|nr:hypothetical protein [Polyangiaceae bacterium]